MKVETGSLTAKEKLELELDSDSRLCNSMLDSLNALGMAPVGEFTTLIGPKGNGKSTFIKTVLSEASFQNVKTLVILSEEKIIKYKQPICEFFQKRNKQDEVETNRCLDNILFTTMMDWDHKDFTVESFLSLIENQIHERGVNFVIFDNFTTSFFGRLGIDKQGEAIEKIRTLVNYYEISFMGVFHTSKGVNVYNKLLDGEDVRGNATSTNLAAYNYVVTTFFRCDPPRTFLHIDKARYHPKMNKTYWELRYKENLGIFTQDRKSSAAQMEAIMAQIKKETKTTGTGGF